MDITIIYFIYLLFVIDLEMHNNAIETLLRLSSSVTNVGHFG